MDFKLIPICSEVGHEMNYKYNSGSSCDICKKRVVSYRCDNCEYSRCSGCHRDILASEEIAQRIKSGKLKNDIRLEELRLKKDNLTQWNVEVKDGKICYINKLLKTYSFDYPSNGYYDVSPIDKTEVRPKKEYDHVRCGIANIYDYMKSFIP